MIAAIQGELEGELCYKSHLIGKWHEICSDPIGCAALS